MNLFALKIIYFPNSVMKTIKKYHTEKKIFEKSGEILTTNLYPESTTCTDLVP